MGECRFENASGRSLDPWCAEHNRSAIQCLRWMRIELDEALVAERLAERHMNVERDEAIMDGLRYKRQRDEALSRVNRARAAASNLIGTERGLCRCCGAHAIQHDHDCPVPALQRALSWDREGGDDG